MKVVKWTPINPSEIKDGDRIKWEEACGECGHMRESGVARVTDVDLDNMKMDVVAEDSREQDEWTIFTDVQYLRDEAGSI